MFFESRLLPFFNMKVVYRIINLLSLFQALLYPESPPHMFTHIDGSSSLTEPGLERVRGTGGTVGQQPAVRHMLRP